jgi:hypothetical protein
MTTLNLSQFVSLGEALGDDIALALPPWVGWIALRRLSQPPLGLTEELLAQ